MALSATANAELKVATVDVQKLFADYYKTHEAQAEVDKAAQTVQETNNTRAETIKKMEADFNDMVKRLQDPMLNEKDKKELEQKAQIKRQEAFWATFFSVSLQPVRLMTSTAASSNAKSRFFIFIAFLTKQMLPFVFILPPRIFRRADTDIV